MKLLIRILLYIFSIILVGILIIATIFLINKKNNKPTYIFNYSTFFVYGSSMNPEYKEGDLVIIKKCDDYFKDDIISFENYDGQTITHRIIDINNKSYLTKGDNNMFNDSAYIPYSSVYGKVVLKISGLYNALLFIIKYKYYFLGLIITGFGLIMILNSRRRHVRTDNC